MKSPTCLTDASRHDGPPVQGSGCPHCVLSTLHLEAVLLLGDGVRLLRVVSAGSVYHVTHGTRVGQSLPEHVPLCRILHLPLQKVDSSISRVLSEWRNSFFWTDNS